MGRCHCSFLSPNTNLNPCKHPHLPHISRNRTGLLHFQECRGKVNSLIQSDLFPCCSSGLTQEIPKSDWILDYVLFCQDSTETLTWQVKCWCQEALNKERKKNKTMIGKAMWLLKLCVPPWDSDSWTGKRWGWVSAGSLGWDSCLGTSHMTLEAFTTQSKESTRRNRQPMLKTLNIFLPCLFFCSKGML